ncbi:MAG TPA: hypothetical protein VFT82_02360, partial [Candidatus Paceibacterota bacterium]|nr:hypothetical protein [Candidatus Paceibacterota bacterium]
MKTKGKSSFIFVLFGATGDLALKKIFPALAALSKKGALGTDPRIIAVSRRDWNDADFRAFLSKEGDPSDASFLESVSYSKIDVEAGTGYDSLAGRVNALQGPKKTRDVVCYTSLAPMFHGKAAEGLVNA